MVKRKEKESGNKEPRESQKHNDAKSGNVLANENSMEEEQQQSP